MVRVMVSTCDRFYLRHFRPGLGLCFGFELLHVHLVRSAISQLLFSVLSFQASRTAAS